MSTAEPIPAARPVRTRRPPHKAAMQAVRRAHLYLGLFLVPWAVLYGVTGFLFNHPTAFSDNPSISFGRDALEGTSLADPPSPAAEAARVVAALQARADRSDVRYALVQPELAAYTREFAFATVKADGKTLNVLLDVSGSGGTIRAQPAEPQERKPAERAPFAVGRSAPAGRGAGGRGAGRPAGGPADDSLKLDDPLPDRVKAAVPAVLKRTGHPAGDVTLTSVPDLTFRMSDQDGTTWVVTYGPLTGTVSGRPAGEMPKESPSVRRFLTRLHLAHGYPSSGGVRWWWAVVVDAMAGVMVFWGVSGLLMWWQIKATRGWGTLVLLLSAAASAALAVGMHRMMTN